MSQNMTSSTVFTTVTDFAEHVRYSERYVRDLVKDDARFAKLFPEWMKEKRGGRWVFRKRSPRPVDQCADGDHSFLEDDALEGVAWVLRDAEPELVGATVRVVQRRTCRHCGYQAQPA